MIKVKAKVFHIRAGEGDGLMGEELERQLNEWLASIDQQFDEFDVVNTKQSLNYDGRMQGTDLEQGFMIYTVLYTIHEAEEE